MKIYNWEVKETTVNEETEEELEVTHTVSLRTALPLGRAFVTIDGTEFNISTRPFGLRGTQQVFRLGEIPAILDFPKRGKPDIVVNNMYVGSGKPYGG